MHYSFFGKSKLMGYGFFAMIILLFSPMSHAQLLVNGMLTPWGFSRSSWRDMAWADPGITLEYNLKNNVIGSGVEIRNPGRNRNSIPTYFLEYRRKFKIKEREFNAGGLFMDIIFNRYVINRNYLLQVGSNEKQLRYRLGVQLQHLDLTAAGKKRFAAYNTMTPQFNGPQLVYELTYLFREENSKWNTSIAVKNIDYFRIGKINEPNFFLKLMYKPIKNLEVNGEFVYLTDIKITESSSKINMDSFLRFGLAWRVFNRNGQ